MFRGALFSPSKLGFLSTLSFGLAQFSVIALYPAIIHATDLSAAQVIAAFTIGSLGFIFGGPFWGKRSDQVGRLPILSIGLLGLSLSFASLLLITEIEFTPTISFALLLAGRILYGLTASAIVSVVQAWWRDLPGDVTAHMFSHSMALNAGRLLAPLIVWLIHGELAPLLWGLCLWSLMLALLAIWGGFIQKASHALNTTTDISFKFSLPLALAFLASAFLGLIHSSLAINLQRHFNLSAPESARLMSQVLIFSGVVVLVLQALLRKQRGLKGLALWWIGLPCWFATSLLFAELSHHTQLWLAVSALSVGIALITPATLSMMPSGGKSAGHVGVAQTLGLTTGGAVSIFVVQGQLHFGSVLFVLCLVMAFLAQRQSQAARCCV